MSGFTANFRYAPPATLSSSPNQNTDCGLSLPEAAGRLAVRRIFASWKRSMNWFRVAVPLATSSVPISVATNLENRNAPCEAR